MCMRNRDVNVILKVTVIMKKIITTVEWTMDDIQNYVVDVLGHKKKEVVYSCELYIIYVCVVDFRFNVYDKVQLSHVSHLFLQNIILYTTKYHI